MDDKSNIKSYGLTFAEQSRAYIETLHMHPEGLNGAKLIVQNMESDFIKGRGYDGTLSLLEEYEEELKYGTIFVSLNGFRTSYRRESNLFCLDTIMIDIDADKADNTYPLSGYEDELVRVLFFAALNGDIPMFNAFSYTGSGGIHLYYTFERLPKQMKKAVKALKYYYAALIAPIVNQHSDETGKKYTIDTNVFDNQRMDRLPGSINKKTGRMCEFFTTGMKKYEFQELLAVDDIEEYDWDRLIEEAKAFLNSDFINSDFVPKFSIKQYRKDAKTLFPKHRVKHNRTNNTKKFKSATGLALDRINNMFAFAEAGYVVDGRREMSCYLLNLFMMAAELPEDEASKKLHDFNNLLEHPLSEKELTVNTRCRKLHKIRDVVIADKLNVKLYSEEFYTLFPNRAGVHKSTVPYVRVNGFSMNKIKTINKLIDQCKVKVEHPEYTQRELAAACGCNISSIKHLNSYLLYFPGIENEWACKDINDEEDIDWIKENYAQKTAFMNLRDQPGHPPLDEIRDFVKAYDEFLSPEIKESKKDDPEIVKKTEIVDKNKRKLVSVNLKDYLPKESSESLQDEDCLAYLPWDFSEVDKRVKKKIKAYSKNPSKKSLWHKDYKNTRQIMRAVREIMNYSSTKGYENFLKLMPIVMKESWLMPDHIIDECINGRHRYSHEHYLELLDNYIEQTPSVIIPTPYTKPYYEGEICKLNRYANIVFHYKPEYFFNYVLWHSLSPDEFDLYTKFFERAQKLKDDLKYCTNCYKKSVKKWDIPNARHFAECIDILIEKLLYHEMDYLSKAKINVYAAKRELDSFFMACREGEKAFE